MVPIVTRLIPDSTYFGISDLSNTIISFCSALAIMGMYDAMYRMFFEKDDDEYQKDICSTALIFTLLTSVAVSIGMLLCKDFIAAKFFGDPQYSYLVYITAIATLVGASNTIISAPIRMQNKRKIFLITNTISPILSYSISIPLLLMGHYIIALPLAGAIAGFTMEITFGVMNHRWFQWRRFHFTYLKQLLIIAIPLVPNFLIYWVFNACDKLMITNILNVGEAGIYSIGSKLGHTSQLIYMAFAGGWQFFAFSTMKESNQVKSNSIIYEYMGIISFSCSMFVFALSKPIYQLLFTENYVQGFIVSPYLFLAPLLQLLFQVASNQFIIVKKTWPNLFILSTGAVINIILNRFLIPVYGIEGAAIATLSGYVVSNVICVIVLYRMGLMSINIRFIFSAMIMAGYILIWRLGMMDSILVSFIIAILCSTIIALFYRKDIGKLFINIAKK